MDLKDSFPRIDRLENAGRNNRERLESDVFLFLFPRETLLSRI